MCSVLSAVLFCFFYVFFIFFILSSLCNTFEKMNLQNMTENGAFRDGFFYIVLHIFVYFILCVTMSGGTTYYPLDVRK